MSEIFLTTSVIVMCVVFPAMLYICYYISVTLVACPCQGIIISFSSSVVMCTCFPCGLDMGQHDAMPGYAVSPMTTKLHLICRVIGDLGEGVQLSQF